MSLTRSFRASPRRRRRQRVDWRRVARRARALGRKLLAWTRAGYRWLRRSHPAVGIPVAAVIVVGAWSATNFAYQVVRKPTLMLYPVSGVLRKSPAETWRQYGPLFEQYSTATISAPLLAALAQVEGSGNPVPQTYWRWRFSWNPFAIYRPASSAVGMYQITDGTFEEARHSCVHHHEVREEGPWYDLRSCWFNGLYTRILPAHAIELTSAHLDRKVEGLLARRHAVATPEQKQSLAALIHLCGAGVGDLYVRRGFRLASGERCGDHEAAGYLSRVGAMEREFAQLAESE